MKNWSRYLGQSGADPGPHRRRYQLPREYQHMILPIFQKLYEFENILDCWEEAHAGGIAIDPPLVMCSFNQNIGLLPLVLIILQ